MLDSGRIEATGLQEQTPGAFRPEIDHICTS